jgi:type I restriction enzyme R subunit
MRKAYDLCQPSGELGEEESALAQCFMGVAGMVYKMNGTDAPDTDTMNKRVAKMVEEALKYNNVESILEDGEEMDIFSPEFAERLSDIKMPASKLEMLIKLLRQQITEYGKTNQVASKKFQEMLEETIKFYHERRKFLSEQEAGATQEHAADDIIKKAMDEALKILNGMKADRESFRKLGLTFEEKAFYDILIHLRDQYNFVYGEDKEVDGVVINEKCRGLARKIKDLIDAKSSYADWLNNTIVREDLKKNIKICLVKNGYPPQYTPEVFREVMDQVENFKENEGTFVRKLENVEDDRDVRNLIYQRIQMDAAIEDMKLQREVMELYGERYSAMSLNDWRHVIEAYTPMVREAAQPKAKEISMQQYGMAADGDSNSDLPVT